jgi:hypothetical protein
VAAGPAEPQSTGGRPPVVSSAGQPCPTDAPARRFDVSAVDLPDTRGEEGTRSVFVPSAQAADVQAGRVAPEPLVLHAAAGECVTVALRNERASARASFHVDKLTRTAASSGINAGYNPEQTVAPGEERTYRYFADSEKIGSAMIADFGDSDSGARGLYGAFVVAPEGAQFSDPRTGLPRDVGAQLDVKLPGGKRYRDFSLLLFDNDAVIGANTMPYPTEVDGPALVNYASAPRPAGPMQFSSQAHGDPVTPILQAHVGDAMRVHVLGAPGSEQPHVFSMGGLRWATDSRLPGANTVEATAVSPWTTTDLEVIGGAGGQGGLIGDMWYGDLRRPFTDAGMWGLLRVLPGESCDVRRLDGAACGTPSAEPTPEAEEPVTPEPVDSGSSQTATTIPGSPVIRAEQPRTTTKPAPRKLSDLVAPSRQTLRALRRSGVQFQVVVPDTARALKVELVAKGKRAAAATATVELAAGGAQKVQWKLAARSLAKVKAGRYILRVRAGKDARSLGPDKLEHALELRATPR